MKIMLSALAEKLGLEYSGNDLEITGVNTLDKAGESDISFLVNPKYAKQLSDTGAGCVLTSSPYADKVDCALVSENVYMDLAKIVHLFEEPQGCLEATSEMAYIHPDADVDETAIIYPFAFVGAGAKIGAGTKVFAGCYIGEKSEIGSNCLLYPNCVVMGGLTVGNNVILQPGSVIGGDGYGFAQTPAGHMKIPQIGNVVIENNVEIGSNSAVDRAALDTTRIGAGTKIDNLVQIGHNVVTGEHCLIVGGVAIGGSTKLGKGVVMGGQASVADNVEIGDGAMVAGCSAVASNVAAGAKVAGIPAIDAKKFFKAGGVCVPKLPELFKRVKRLEKELEAAKAAMNGDNDE